MPGLVHRLHDSLTEEVGGEEHQVAVAVGQPVEGIDVPGDELFHDVVHLRFAGKELDQVMVVLQPVGVHRSNPSIGLGHHRIARVPDQGAGIPDVADHPASRHRNSGLPKRVLHPGFAADRIDLADTHPENVEVVPDPGFGRQPVLVQRLESVDLAVFMGEIPASPEQCVVVVHVVDAEVFGQSVAHLGGQMVVLRIANAKDVGSGLFELAAEVGVVGREVGREEDDVHGDHLWRTIVFGPRWAGRLPFRHLDHEHAWVVNATETGNGVVV